MHPDACLTKGITILNGGNQANLPYIWPASDTWRLILSPPADAFTNMALDEAMARALNPIPTLRVYYWDSPAISIGYFQKAVEVLNTFNTSNTFDMVQPAPILVRRPTGGTAVLHKTYPSFSVALRTHLKIGQIYYLLAQSIVTALRDIGLDAIMWKETEITRTLFCTSNFSPCDILLNGQKVAGYSARRFREISLFQGYLHLPRSITLSQQTLIETLTTGIRKTFPVKLKEGGLYEAEVLLAQELKQKKYVQRAWNYKR